MTPSERYRIVQRLGRQQQRKFSEVFLVEDKYTGQRGTMKVLAKTAANERVQERLRQEATFDFQHPQLPGTLFTYESDTELVIVRSWFEGVPLDNFLETVRQKEKPAVLLQFLRQLEPVFAELKRMHIVHLDLKPSNFIVSGTEEALTVSLIDFGMAMRTEVRENRGTLFPLGYAAPELLLNRLHLADQRTDLFALGIVLWQSFTGQLPLLHPNPGITTNLQLTHPLPQHDRIPKAFFPVLQRLCAKHSFAVPPNQLPENELHKLLQQAIEQRYAGLPEVIADWDAAVKARKGIMGWFGF